MATVRLNNPTPDEINYLRKYFAMNGGGSESTMSGTFEDPPQQNMLAQLMRPQQPQQMQQAPQFPDAMAGEGFQGLQSGQGVIQQTNEDGSMSAPIRINSQPQQPRMAERDMTRNPVDLPGGRGYYGKDGQVYTANGSLYQTPQTQATNAAMSMAEQDRQLKIAQIRGQMAKTEAETTNLNLKPMSQPDKAPPGYAWAEGGKLQAIPGGPADMKIGKDALDRADSVKGIVDTGNMALSNIDQMIGKRDATGALLAGEKPHGGFETAVGLSGWDGGFGAAGFIPGTDTTNFKTRLDQLKGGAFLQAFEKLKGGGAISEVEGKKATAAITRMGTSQSEKEFVQAAQEYRQVIEQGMTRAQGRLPGNVQQSPQGAQAMPTSKASLVAGQAYRTPRGLAVWNGSAFEAQ